MSNDRRTGLDTGLARQAPSGEQGFGSDRNQRDKPGEDDTNAFKRAMNGPAEALPHAALATPFGLFGAASREIPAKAAAAKPLDEIVGVAAKRLMVSDQGGSGPREVRLELADDFLPDVSVSLYEEAGQLVAAFRCGTDEAQARVSGLAPGLANDLAASLSRQVRVNLQNKEGADLYPGQWVSDVPEY
ncbi:hypothetical protein [Achromobacter marplatensis]|uniref:hypothetical protein n=1 Tax=Achromobacter marplatensis TaxID=470868 RepID=UPI0039F69B6A